jgi:hypothetical protein
MTPKEKAESELFFIALLMRKYLQRYRISREELNLRLDEQIRFLSAKESCFAQSQLSYYEKIIKNSFSGKLAGVKNDK